MNLHLILIKKASSTLKELRSLKNTIVNITHKPEEFQYADNIYEIEDGNINILNNLKLNIKFKNSIIYKIYFRVKNLFFYRIRKKLKIGLYIIYICISWHLQAIE